MKKFKRKCNDCGRKFKDKHHDANYCKKCIDKSFEENKPAMKVLFNNN